MFPLCPPEYLSCDQISFIIQFYPRLFNLPGSGSPNSKLRRCLAAILLDFPRSITDPLLTFQIFSNSDIDHFQSYQGDLEKDYLRFLGQIQNAARDNPVGIEVDFRKTE
jgi:hypothetical protein